MATKVSKTNKVSNVSKEVKSELTKVVANSSLRATKKPENRIKYSMLLEDNKQYKFTSLFRLLDFLNASQTVQECKLDKKLSIDDLKALCPEQFEKKYTKTGKEVIKEFKPFPFLVELRKLYGI